MNWAQLKELAQSHLPMDPEGCMIHIAGADPVVVGELVRDCEAQIRGAGNKVRVMAAGSFGYDDLEPIVAVRQNGRPVLLYANMMAAGVQRLARDLAEGRELPGELVLCSLDPMAIEGVQRAVDRPLFNLQQRVVLRNCGFLDPDDLFAYITMAQGYGALAHALESGPEQVIERIAAAGLRGRGGGGFPTAVKWRTCREAPPGEKVVICNAMDGDPKARTAGLLLGGDPHSVLEGLLIGAYAVGAARCIICVDREEETILGRLEHALAQMRAHGLLGGNILEAGFQMEIEVVPLAASLVAGEQTALLRSLQGRQAMPYIRTSHSAVNGLAGQPTLIHNIETLAHVTAILQRRAGGRAQTETSETRDTKVMTISGQTARCITVEVPLGTPLGRIVAATGGELGVPVVKAIQLGGPSGAYFAGEGLDTALDFDTLAARGAFLGSGTLEMIPEGSCAVATARDATAYLQSQSCGQCVFCREGSLQLADILESITANTARARDLDLIQELGRQMKTGCICGLGRTAAIPALSSLALFPQEYEVHIREKRCSADITH